MFQEDCCLQCGKPVQVDGRIYCSDECQSLDATSPSISSASSPFSSPNLKGYPTPGTADVPPLFPNALGSALTSHKSRPNRYSLSSSKSSLMWYEDDDSDSPAIAVEDEPAPEHNIPIRHQGLSYARRPSTTNNHSTIPLLHRHHSSSASGGQSPTSAFASSFTSSAADDSANPYLRPPSPTLHSSSSPSKTKSHHHRHGSHDSKIEGTQQETVTSKRKRNRASLPAYFSLLSIGSPPVRPSTSITTSSYSTMRPSPTTPRISNPTVDSTHAIALSSPNYTTTPPISSGPASAGARPSSLLASIHTTSRDAREVTVVDVDPPRGRGRRREPGSSRHRTSSRSDSPSPSRDRAHWARKTVSPPARKHDAVDLDSRGRRRLAELDGWEGDREYGFGSGRSGLRDRQRERERGRGRDR
ncbi:uncharacterized protein STEHIDRAFT_165969 [Stereum hirsutum FP-91666 SS1]|uniref:uncharacterized protein n=1 Tax=Stereum hirsutum (strain FP-91666) TaxID=721885 RepID=UPI000440E017|nr:uncharacterized protein STEHIDRAFT_165969 [Stereum hirsutum FP-91666 SS1]EIM89581.1 hypothetical protein STEHIDRAFT_165969 [Stereum hirsutum FP-91666 SS1]